MSEDLLNMLAECESAEDLAALEALAAELPVQPEPRILRTLGEVAAFFGVQPQTVRAWRMESPPMPGEPGRYDLDQIEAWKAQRALRNEVPGMAELNVASQRAELARRLESVRGRQLKNKQIESRLVPLTVIENTYPRVIEKLHQKFDRFHERCADRVAVIAPPEVIAVLGDEIQQTISIGIKTLDQELTSFLDDCRNGRLED